MIQSWQARGVQVLASCAVVLLLSIAMMQGAAASPSHSNTAKTPMVSGGGCYNYHEVGGHLSIGPCISINSYFNVVPDAYVSNDGVGTYTYCNVNIYLYDQTTGANLGNFSSNCLVNGRPSGHYYGWSLHATSGHKYVTTVAWYVTWNGSNYGGYDGSPTVTA